MAAKNKNNSISKPEGMATNIIKNGDTLRQGKYKILETIGEGGYGFVFLIEDKKEKKKYALKMLKNPVFDEHDVETYFQEIKFLKEQSNEFILQYIDHYFENNKPCIITLYYKDGDLDELIQKKKKENQTINENDIIKWSTQILSGLSYLHSRNIVHRDIKPKNIFRNGESVVIGDLGLAKTVDKIRSSTKVAGTWNYISPDCINEEKITCASDIWSFGCVFFELVKLEKAFDAKTEFGVMTAIVNAPIPQLQNDKFQNILLKCLIREPNERAKTEELIADFNELIKPETLVPEGIQLPYIAYEAELVSEFVPTIEVNPKIENLKLNDDNQTDQETISYKPIQMNRVSSAPTQKLNQAESEIKIDNRVQEIVSYHQDIYDDMKKENVLLMNRIGSAPKITKPNVAPAPKKDPVWVDKEINRRFIKEGNQMVEYQNGQLYAKFALVETKTDEIIAFDSGRNMYIKLNNKGAYWSSDKNNINNFFAKGEWNIAP